ncbi:MAG: DEAD/DEAH box helicase, partial [Myxococcota bacterium]
MTHVTTNSALEPEQVMGFFQSPVRRWFERRFPLGPSAPQTLGWPRIATGEDTLIAAPTGSGKTLAAFLVCIDRFYAEAEGARCDEGLPLFAGRPMAEAPPADRAPRPRGPEVVYVSPLKALAADIQHNLQEPLEEIAEQARRQGVVVPEIRVALRSGDTPSSERVAMLKRPPQILVTTPESLFLMLTAEKSRRTLQGVRTVILDEIHAVARDKRGSHLALSLERLDRLCVQRPTRVGLSATQRPIETVARFLVGAGAGRSHPDGAPRCQIVDVGHERDLDLDIELPETDLEAVASAEQMSDVLGQIAQHVGHHRTTLVFVNTRRMAERMAHELAERLGEGQVASHHGSLSRDRRLRVERQLRAGELKALVATASLELGIDIGPVELVCQIGSPRGLSTFLQRVGRSGHRRGATPKGRIYPTTRDELVECVALLRGVRAGHLDAVHPPEAPLDILAQQIVAACAAEEWEEGELFGLMRGAAPFAELSRADFDAVVALLAEGIQTGRGRRAAYLHRDRVNGVLRPRRGARLAALTSGGAIPEVADYRVLADPDDTFVGSVFEDFAIESMPGDIFLLGSTSWRIRRVESGVVRVVDAGGAPPTIPFWQGEAPARSDELCREVSDLREATQVRLERGGREAVARWLVADEGIPEVAASQLAAYLDVSRTALGALPTRHELVFERFFDEAGGMQLVVHSPYGARVNRALCLALRKKFCRSFNFELQAAASDDALVLSLGPHHSFPLDSVPRFLNSSNLQDTLEQAVLASPMFTARWRWNLNRSLAVLRWRNGRRNPPPIQRMESDDLMAAVFPNQAACQENVTFPIEIPDHPLVRQTMHDCLHEAMDIETLAELVRGFETGEIRTRFVDGSEPSPLAYEILNGKPFTFLDDAPLEERRTRAVALPRGLPVEARDLARLDPEAIERVRAEVGPEPRNPEELHDLMLSLVLVSPESELRTGFDVLVETGRAVEVEVADGAVYWCVSERRRTVESLHPTARIRPDVPLPAALADQPTPDREAAIVDLLRGHIEVMGPVRP